MRHPRQLFGNHGYGIIQLAIAVVIGFWVGALSVVCYAAVIDTPVTIETREAPPVETLATVPTKSVSIELLSTTIVPVPVEPKLPAPTPTPEPPPYRLRDHFGEPEIITPEGTKLTYLTLPTEYYPGIDFSYFKAWMPYTVLGRNNQCGRIAYGDRAFTDENGLRRYQLGPEDFTTNGQPDYLVAMGTFYKPKGTVGQRYLIVTPTGSYTVRTSDELADVHSDQHNMFSRHGRYATVLEFLVDKRNLASSAKQMGTVSVLGGMLGEEIIAIYLIN